MTETDPEQSAAREAFIRSQLDPVPWTEFQKSGLLWFVNRFLFHDLGYALSLAHEVIDGVRDPEPAGWRLLGDGSEPWRFADPEDEKYLTLLSTVLDEATIGKLRRRLADAAADELPPALRDRGPCTHCGVTMAVCAAPDTRNVCCRRCEHPRAVEEADSDGTA